MDILISYIIVFLCGFYCAAQIFAHQLKRALQKITKEQGISMEEVENTNTINIPILFTEQMENGILVYDMQNNFMTQGSTLDEAAQNLLQYKNIKLAFITHNKNKFMLLNGKVQASNES